MMDSISLSNYFIEISRSANEEPVKYKLDKLLGNGASSSVYSLVNCDDMKECNDLVAKVFNSRERFENEQKIMDKIAEKRHNHKGEVDILRELNDGTITYKTNHFSDKFVNRVAANASRKTIIYTPKGEKPHRPFSREHLEQIFGCMRELSNTCIVHRNITPDHLLSRRDAAGNEKIFLVGFSSAENIEHEAVIEPRPFQMRNCDGIIMSDSYTPHRRLDLESCLKTIYLLNMPDLESDTARDYWDKFEDRVDAFWKKALRIVRGTCEDLLMKNLYEHFSKFQPLPIKIDAPLKN